MSDDLDIYRAAKLVIDQHGCDAALYASGSADVLLEDGDIEGATIGEGFPRRSKSYNGSDDRTRRLTDQTPLSGKALRPYARPRRVVM